MRVSSRFRGVLRGLCERLIEAGFNCLPKWADSKAPAFRRGERFYPALVRPLREHDDLRRLVLSRFEDPGVGGLAVVSGCCGVYALDYDVAKLSVERYLGALRVAARHGPVYSDTRVVLDPAGLGGFHFIVRSDVGPEKRIVVHHEGGAEAAVKYGPVTVAPSLLARPLSVYVRVSFVELPQTLYDEGLRELSAIVSDLGGRLVVEKVPQARWRGEELLFEDVPGERPPLLPVVAEDNVLCIIAEAARLLGFHGVAAVAEALSAEPPVWPVPYFIYNTVVPVSHPRSSWTLVENCLFHWLYLMGLTEEHPAAEHVYRRVVEAQEEWMRVNGSVDHDADRVAENMRRALAGKPFGRCAAGACVCSLVGLEAPGSHSRMCLSLTRRDVDAALHAAAARCPGGGGA